MSNRNVTKIERLSSGMVKLYNKSNVIGAFSALNSISIGYENNNARTIQFTDNGNTISFQLFNLQEIIGSTTSVTYTPIDTTSTGPDYNARVFEVFDFLSSEVFQGFSPGPTYVGGVVAAYPNFASFPVTGTQSVIYIDEADNSAYYWDGTSYQLLVSTGVEQYASFALFPVTGSANVIYIDMSTFEAYVWDGAAYEPLAGGSGVVSWGDIIGTLSDQTDLQAALDAKFDDPTGTTAEYIRGDGSLATFPTIPGGTVTAVTATAPMSSTGGATPNLSMTSANGTTNGYLLSSDWLIFNGKFNTPSGTTLQYVRGDGSLATFPVIPAQYNPSAGTGISITGAYPNQTITNTAPDQTVALTAGVGIGVTGTYPNFTITNSSPSSGGTVTSVGMTVPSAFSVTPSTITSSGTFSVTGAGVTSQYVRGDGTLANFPSSTGGGASLSYYLNGSVGQGTFGGVGFKEMDKTPVLGAGTDFTINADGYIQSFITDANVPNQLEIPAGNWNFETYFSASSGGGSPSFYVELYKWDGTTLSLIASNSANPEGITNGTAIDVYTSALAVPQTTLAATDRLAIRIYVTHSGKTITLHTENSHLCQVITTFSTGLTALNGLTAQVQNFATGTAGTDFTISSATSTHTFNLPTASATNRGALSAANWTTFNNKQDALVSGTNIKTLEGQSLLGSGNIDLTKSDVGLANVDNTSDLNKPISTATQTALNAKQDTLTLTTTGTSGAATLVGSTLNIPQYSGGSASSGTHTPFELGSGKIYSNIPIGANSSTAPFSTPNLILIMPFKPAQTFTTSNIFINASVSGAGVNARILLYSHSATNGLPDTKIYESANLDCSTTGIKTATTAQTFTAGTTYWLGVHASGIVSFTGVGTAVLFQIGMDSSTNQYTAISRSVAFGSAPSTWGTTGNQISANFPRIALTIA